MTIMRSILCLVLMSAGFVFGQGPVTIYPVPPGETASSDYSIEINGLPAEAYAARLGEKYEAAPYHFGDTYSFVQFDFSGVAEVKIHASGRNLAKAAILPRSMGIKPSVVDENTIILTLNQPCKLSVEPDGRKKPLLIFGNAPEQDAPREGDQNVLFFGPGVHRPESGVVEVKSNQTLYLAGGAVLESTVRVQDADNVSIRGRGVLSGNRWGWH